MVRRMASVKKICMHAVHRMASVTRLYMVPQYAVTAAVSGSRMVLKIR